MRLSVSGARRPSLLLVLGLVSSCAAPDRPKPGEGAFQGITVQDWVEIERESEFDQRFQEHVAQRVELEGEAGAESRISVLALSGGGQKGAFGAGILSAWPRPGEGREGVIARPEFDVVTGVSTGALQATAAFLGEPELDEELLHLYTSITDEDVYEERSFLKLLWISGFTRYTGLEALLRDFVDNDVIDRVGAEYPKGRSLWIGTTNLDTGRFHTWNLTYVAWRALQGEPDFYELYRELILSSASIPMVVEPRYIHGYMHGDGGVLRNVFVPHMLEHTLLEEHQTKLDVEVFLIQNGRLEVDALEQEPRMLKIGARSVELLMTQNSYNGLVAVRQKLATFVANNPETDLDHLRGYIAYIPHEFRVLAEPGKEFDPVYMRQLAELGETFVTESRWETEIPADPLLAQPPPTDPTEDTGSEPELEGADG